MTKLLLRLFVKDHENTESTAVRTAMGTLSGAVGILCNLLLAALKLLAGAMSGSLAITVDALNNLSDATGSIVTLIGFRLAGKPADEHHPYGHARLEYLSGLAVAVLILFIGAETARSSVLKILNPTQVVFSWLTVGILLASIGIKLWMSVFNTGLGRSIRSSALLAAAADSRNDCVATAAVLLSSLVGQLTDQPVDGMMGLAVAVFILHSGWNMAKETVSPLLGESTDPELRQKIVDYIERQPKVLGFHDLMVHDYGAGQRFASIHVEMDKNEDPLLCHELIDDMERECLCSHNIHLVIHYDPVVTDDPELNRMRTLVAAILQMKNPQLSIHDFRMVPGAGHTNLIFDVALPAALRGQEEQIQTSLEKALNGMGQGVYYTVITFDNADCNGY